MRPYSRVVMMLLCLAGAKAAVSQFSFVELHPSSGYLASEARGGGAGHADFGTGSTTRHAAAWLGTTFVDLHPLVGYQRSLAKDGDAGWQGGAAHVQGTDFQHAFLWNGSPASGVDLHPAGYATSIIEAVSGGQQAGIARLTNTLFRAALWAGTAESFVSLHPTGYLTSAIFGTNGVIQTGVTRLEGSSSAAETRASMWSGTTNSFVDLHPTGHFSSVAFGAGTSFQFGSASLLQGGLRAARWQGSSQSFFDLHPAGALKSEILDAAGTDAVGYADMPGTRHALLWKDNGNTVVDLNQYLSSSYLGATALGIDAQTGWIYGRATHVSGRDYAVMWRPVPEPGTLAALGTAVALLLRRRKRAA